MTHQILYQLTAGMMIGLCSCFAFTSCSSDSDESEDKGRQLLKLTVNDVPFTRAAISDEGIDVRIRHYE